MPLRCVYTDLDGTLLGKGGSLFRDAEGGFSLAQARALEACHRAGVEVVIMSGRREAQVLEDARLMGQASYIYEAGCAFVIDGETTLLTGDMTQGEGGTIYEQIEARGIPKLLFDHFEGRLEYHSPWHHGRVLSHLFRGKVDVDEANGLLDEHGHDDLRLLDNGAISRPMPGIEIAHAYHLVPGMVSKAAAVAAHARARGYDPAECIAVGDSVEDLEVAAAVGRFFVVANGPGARPRRARRARRLGQRHGHRGPHGRRLLRGGRLRPGRAPPTLEYPSLSQENATVAEQEYLEIMFWLEEAGLPMTGANIARAMQLSPPTVHEMIGRLVEDGYVERSADKSLSFTESGREHASHIVRRHRMIERFLTDVLGIPWDEVHEEAERLEHAMSPVLEERMMAAIGDATTCPHGHPIVEGAREQGALLADVEVGADVHVLRFENEAEELLHYLKDAGLEPGAGGQGRELRRARRHDRLRRRRPRGQPQRRRDRLGPRRPGAAAARGDPGAAGPLQRPLRPVGAQPGLGPLLGDRDADDGGRGRLGAAAARLGRHHHRVDPAHVRDRRGRHCLPVEVGREQGVGGDHPPAAPHPRLQDLVVREPAGRSRAAGCPCRPRGIIFRGHAR